MASISIGTLYGYASGSNYGRYSCSLQYDSVTRSGTTVTMNNAKVVMTRYSSGYTTNRLAIRAGYNGSETNLKNNATINSSGTASAASYNISLGSPSLITVGTSFSFYVALASTGGSSSWNNFIGNSPIVLSTTISCPAANPTFTSNPTVSAINETQVSLTCGATDISSNMYYNIDGGGWTYINTSPLTVSGLTGGKTYNFRVQARNAADESLTTTYSYGTDKEEKLPVTTKPYPTVSSWPGNIYLDTATKSISMGFSNPLGRTITLTATAGNYSVSNSTSGGNVSLSLNSDSLYSAMGASSTSITITLTASGGGITGTVTKTITAYAVADYAKPEVKTAGFIWAANHPSDIKNCFTNTAIMVQNKSYMTVRMSSLANIMTANKSASPSKAYITFGNLSKQALTTSNAAYVSSSTTFNYASASNATITVEDSRGYTNSATISIPFIGYSNPVASISGARSDGYGTTVVLTFKGSCASLNSTNSITKYYWRTASTSSWTEVTSTSVTTTLSSSASQTYYLKVRDKAGNDSSEVNYTVTAGEPILMIESSKQGVGVNCYPSGKGLYTRKLQIGTSTQSSMTEDGIKVHDLRSLTVTANTFGDQSANLFFQQIDGVWHSIFHVKGWSGSYQAWELAGPANSNNTTATGLKIRTGLGSSWTSWKTIATTDIIESTYLKLSGGTLTGALTVTGGLSISNGAMTSTYNGKYVIIGCQNSMYCHYQTDSTYGHWFNKSTYVAGSLYKGSNYNLNVPAVFIQSSQPTASQVGDIWFS